MKTRLLLAALCAASPLFANVVINEIHYNPDPGADTSYEFFELHNTDLLAVDISGWSVTAGVVHTFPAGTSIPAQGFLVVAKLASTYTGEFGLSNVVQWTSGDLNNSGETLSLTNAGGALVDTVPYDDGGCWTLDPDGQGPSLELISPILDNSLCSSWAASAMDYGTPGAVNSAYVAPGGPPVISALVHVPVAPSFTDNVSVSATITDDGTVLLAQVEYQVDAGPSQFQPLFPQGGDLWLGTLPAQSAGATVTYRVTATDDDGTVSVSPWSGYNVASGSVDIVINELHYNGIESGTDVTEFIELLNHGTASVNLGGWTLSGVTFTFPAGVVLAPGSFLVVAVNAAAFLSAYGFSPDFQWTSGALSNDGEAIVLSNAFAQEMDRVVYDDVAPWPTTPDGFGPSLELLDASLDNLLASSWQSSYVDGGTPRAANSAAPVVEALEQPMAFALELAWPNPFNPVTHLRFSVAETMTLRLTMHDVAGRQVAVLADGLQAAGSHEVLFDAKGLASGVYVARLSGGGQVQAQRLLLLK
jgi:hypothetical protein